MNLKQYSIESVSTWTSHHFIQCRWHECFTQSWALTRSQHILSIKTGFAPIPLTKGPLLSASIWTVLFQLAHLNASFRAAGGCLASSAVQMTCWFAAEINFNTTTSRGRLQEDFKPLASHWMTEGSLRKQLMDPDGPVLGKQGFQPARRTENTVQFTCNPTCLISKETLV